jgi:hypothetical protein
MVRLHMFDRWMLVLIAPCVLFVALLVGLIGAGAFLGGTESLIGKGIGAIFVITGFCVAVFIIRAPFRVPWEIDILEDGTVLFKKLFATTRLRGADISWIEIAPWRMEGEEEIKYRVRVHYPRGRSDLEFSAEETEDYERLMAVLRRVNPLIRFDERPVKVELPSSD